LSKLLASSDIIIKEIAKKPECYGMYYDNKIVGLCGFVEDIFKTVYIKDIEKSTKRIEKKQKDFENLNNFEKFKLLISDPKNELIYTIKNKNDLKLITDKGDLKTFNKKERDKYLRFAMIAISNKLCEKELLHIIKTEYRPPKEKKENKE